MLVRSVVAAALLVAASAFGSAVGAGVFAGSEARAQTQIDLYKPTGLEAMWGQNIAPLRRGTPMPLSTKAPNAIVIDVETGRILGVKKADRAIAPASMTKIMTALMVFEALERGDLTLFDTVRVSEYAASAPGSSMRLRAGDEPTVDQLLRGLLISSGNDAARALAEALAGSEDTFAERMTDRARELGLVSATFKNASGLPAAGHQISVKDLAALSVFIIAQHPEHFPIFGEVSFSYRDNSQLNRNPAVFLDMADLRARGDGLKTGHTSEAGYCVAASALIETEDGPRHVVAVLAGMRSEKQREQETEKILRWGVESATRLR